MEQSFARLMAAAPEKIREGFVRRRLQMRLRADMAGKLLDLTKTTQRLNMPLNLRVLDRLYTEHLAQELDGLTKQALADRVGAPLRSVNRVLRVWLEQGVVEYRAGQFHIPEPERLSRILNPYWSC